MEGIAPGDEKRLVSVPALSVAAEVLRAHCTPLQPRCPRIHRGGCHDEFFSDRRSQLCLKSLLRNINRGVKYMN